MHKWEYSFSFNSGGGGGGGHYEGSHGGGQRQYNENNNRGGGGQRGGPNPNYRGKKNNKLIVCSYKNIFNCFR